MPNIEILVLAILQGATEFLPVGSSGHLIMVPQLYCWGPQALGLELAALLGALVAVMVCFAGDLIGISVLVLDLTGQVVEQHPAGAPAELRVPTRHLSAERWVV